MIKIHTICALCLLFSQTAAQPDPMPLAPKNKPRTDSLYALYGKNKKLPNGFEEQALIALSHYPQLKAAHICFVVKRAKLPYASKPTFFSMLRFWAPIKYVIIVSSQSTAVRAPTLLKNLSWDAQIGALGHELAHTAYYQKTGRLKIMSVGIRYPSNKFKEKFEKMTDRIALAHGLGTYILEWNTSVYPVKIKDGKRGKIYYTPDELTQLINTIGPRASNF